MYRFGKVTTFLVILLGACSRDLPVDKETMHGLLVDAMRLEASQQVAYHYLLLPDSIWEQQYAFVLKKHGVEKVDFIETMEYYKQHGKEFAALMTEVVLRLESENNKDFKR